MVSHRVAGSPGAEGATETHGPITTDEWRAAEAYAAALEARVPKGVKVELLDRLKSHPVNLQFVINFGILDAPCILVFRDGVPDKQLLARWAFLPATHDVLRVVS